MSGNVPIAARSLRSGGVREAGRRLTRAAEQAAEDRRASKRLAAELETCTRERDDAYKSLNKDQAEYDKQLLVLSAGFLALALGFIKDVVPLKDAIHLWTLYLGFCLLALCVFVVLASFQYSIHGNFRVATYWENKSAMLSSDADQQAALCTELGTIQAKIAAHAKRIKFVNRSSGVLFGLGVALLVYFVVSNVESQSNANPAPQHVSLEWR